ncbi:hypothetical protein B2J88_40770 [Rhodococcus sp. SRB_17]|nr:hypothetical protein [Rhodococcus sp. SRB_17]
MWHRRLIAFGGTLLCFTALLGCQSNPESTAESSTSTVDNSGNAATETGTMQVGNPPIAGPPSITLPPVLTPSIGTDTNSPSPLAEVTGVTTEHLYDHSRVTYQLDGNGTVAWKVEYVSEAIRGGDSKVVDVGGRSIIQVDIMGVTAPQPFPPINAHDGTVMAVETASVSSSIVQSFIGTATSHPGFRVTETESPDHLVVDIFFAGG